MSELRPGVIVDRDGTLIDVVRDEETGVVSAAFHPAQLRLLPGVVEGLQAFVAAGRVIAIATNQPGAAKGQFGREAIARTNAALVELLAEHGVAIESVEVCLHHPDGGPGGDESLVGPCDCRKPAPGLLLRALSGARLDPHRTWMIGDTAADLGAARAAALRVGLVFPKNRCELCPLRDGPPGSPDLWAQSFDELAREILRRP
jgi:D-glycero-D-manno-heptose 1,7-bisphosphate phosphatase